MVGRLRECWRVMSTLLVPEVDTNDRVWVYVSERTGSQCRPPYRASRMSFNVFYIIRNQFKVAFCVFVFSATFACNLCTINDRIFRARTVCGPNNFEVSRRRSGVAFVPLW